MANTDERKFIHDIASPLGSAIFILDMALETMKSTANSNSEEWVQIQQVADILSQLKKKLEDRRELLISKTDSK
jgi:hypothetical protein